MTNLGTPAPQRHSEIAQVIDNWLGYGLSTEPADWDNAEQGGRLLYEAANQTQPKCVLRVSSPAAALLTIEALRSLKLIDKKRLGGERWEEATPHYDMSFEVVFGRDAPEVAAQINALVGETINRHLQVPLWLQLQRQTNNRDVGAFGRMKNDLFGTPINKTEWSELAVPLWDDLTTQLTTQLGELKRSVGIKRSRRLGRSNVPTFGGQWDAFSVVFADSIRWQNNVVHQEMNKVSQAEALLAQSSGPCWAYKNVLILTDRPSSIVRDQQSRLHNEHGPAMLFRDGYSLYSWHGTTVDARTITDDPSSWSTESLIKERNLERRRVRIERHGWERFIEQADLKLVDRQPDPANTGYYIDLYELPHRVYSMPTRVIMVTNGSVERDGTRRRFALSVPADINDAIEAAAFTYNLTKSDYLTAQRRT